jgi:hypothetical protein
MDPSLPPCETLAPPAPPLYELEEAASWVIFSTKCHARISLPEQRNYMVHGLTEERKNKRSRQMLSEVLPRHQPKLRRTHNVLPHFGVAFNSRTEG